MSEPLRFPPARDQVDLWPVPLDGPLRTCPECSMPGAAQLWLERGGRITYHCNNCFVGIRTPHGAWPHAHEAAIVSELERLRVRRAAERALEAEERGARDIPAGLNLATWLEEPEPELEWRIDGWQPEGSRAMLAAQFKAGKTSLRDNLLRSLVDSAPFLGRFAVRPVAGSVGVLDTEMGRRQMRKWLRDQAITNAHLVEAWPLRGEVASLNLLDPEVRSSWAKVLRACGVRYLVLDCLRPVLDALGLDEHKDAGKFLVAFDELLAEAEIPDALVVHHMGHSNERSRGDSRLRDWPDVEWRLVREDPDDPASPRFLSAYGRDVDQPEQRLCYDEIHRRLSIDGGSRQDAKVDAALKAVLDLLRAEAAPRTLREVQCALEDSEHGRAAVRRALHVGLERGLLDMQPGPRRSHLYSPVCRSVPECAAAQSSECAGASIGGAHSQHTQLPLSVRESAR